MESPVKKKQLQLAEYFDTPTNDGTNLYGEFLDTLILTDDDMPVALAQAIWLLVTTDREDADLVRNTVAYAFMDSDGPDDLRKRWQTIVEEYMN